MKIFFANFDKLVSKIRLENPYLMIFSGDFNAHYSFPEAQFSSNGYVLPHLRDRALGGGGLMLFVNGNIPSKKLTEHILPEDIEILCAEINLKKQKWIIMGVYHPPNTNDKYFMDYLSKAIEFYSTKSDGIVIIGDFNLEPSTYHIMFCTI